MPLPDTHEPSNATHGAPVARPVEPVEDALRARLGQEWRELSGADLAGAFSRLLDERIGNQRIVDSAQVTHGADGVLRAAEPTNNKRSETLREGRR